jgi:putative nucleotidyltransferase with HDIG domain
LDIGSGLLRARFATDLEEGLVAVLGKASGTGLILSKNLFLQGESERGFTLVQAGGAERTARVNEVLDLREAKTGAAAEIGKLDLSGRAKNLLTELAGLLLSANVTYSKIETEARRARARAGVETVFYTIKRGKVIIRKGDEAGAETVKLLGLINRSLEVKSSWASSFAGTAMLFALLFITLWYYLKSALRRDQALQKFIMTGTTLILSLLIYRLGALLGGSFADAATWPPFANAETYTFAIPFQAGTLLFAFLAANEFALVYAILNSLMVGYFLGGAFPPLIFAFVGGLAALYGVKYYQRRRRTAILRAGFFILAPVNIFVILTLHLIRERLIGLDVLLAEVVLALVGAALSATLAFVLLPIFETVFGLVTGNRLLELSNSDLPIFRRLAIEAPGTYHHSLLVATLAEKAAEEIKADAPLVKAAALYHDIGKLKRPEYFIENRSREVDTHKDLTPAMSTLVIISHVKEGLELARQLKLPRGIREVVEQHHGTSLVRYFFQKAKEKYDPEQQTVGEESYRYPGPVPQSREAALVMLADSVEAASRSLRSPSLDSLKRVITDILNGYLQDGQLDDCDFSLRELRAVATAFLSILYAVYHPRVEYPGFDFEMKNRKKKANGRHPQPPA